MYYILVRYITPCFCGKYKDKYIIVDIETSGNADKLHWSCLVHFNILLGLFLYVRTHIHMYVYILYVPHGFVFIASHLSVLFGAGCSLFRSSSSTNFVKRKRIY